MVYIPPAWIWIVVVGFIIAFILALGIGANDVANTFGTSVGSKVLTLKQAVIIASIVETAGAVFLGAKVADTIRKGIISVDQYENQTELFMAGNLAALSGSCIWLIIATFFKLPVSTTHSIVGATVGFALVAHGSKGVNWSRLGFIVGSWFISPLMSGIVSSLIFIFCKIFILDQADPLEPGLRLLPIFYGFTLAINIFSIFYEGPDLLQFDRIPLWGVFVLAFGTGIVCAILVRFILVPWQRRKIIDEVSKLNQENQSQDVGEINKGFDDITNEKNKAYLENGIGSQGDYPTKEQYNTEIQIDNKNELTLVVTDLSKQQDCEECESHKDHDEPSEEHMEDVRNKITDRPEQARLFSFLQILTAVFGGFAHGGNDVSNAISPIISIWLTATTGQIAGKAATPMWILFLGGVGISFGLLIWGRRVIETLGKDLTKVTPSSGFCIEVGAALTVLIASNVGVPISSTHCKVGSIVVVGRVRSKGNVNWSIFRNIVGAWVLTLPVCMGLSAAFMALLKLAI